MVVRVIVIAAVLVGLLSPYCSCSCSKMQNDAQTTTVEQTE